MDGKGFEFDCALPGFGQPEKSLVLDSQPVNPKSGDLAAASVCLSYPAHAHSNPNSRVELAHDARASETPDPSRTTQSN